MGEGKRSDVCSFIHYMLRPMQSVGMNWEQPGQALLSAGYVLQDSGTLGNEAIIPGSQGKPKGPLLLPSPSLLCKGERPLSATETSVSPSQGWRVGGFPGRPGTKLPPSLQ